ncbi:MAG: hypothetical protein JWP30_317 [Homoserinimonas sp.]|nr:hypothetical protein [Homoserinimonas sp.]
MLRPAALAAIAPLLFTALSGCASIVPLTAAEDATNPDCAEMVVRLPDAIDEHELRETNAQATAAWGSPAVILFRCGVEVPGPSTLPCYTLRGVDWLRDDSDAPNYVFTTYGRDPAVEVIIDGDKASSNALVALANAVGSVPAQGECVDAEDVLGEE